MIAQINSIKMKELMKRVDEITRVKRIMYDRKVRLQCEIRCMSDQLANLNLHYAQKRKIYFETMKELREAEKQLPENKGKKDEKDLMTCPPKEMKELVDEDECCKEEDDGGKFEQCDFQCPL